MSQTISLGVEKDHVEALTSASGITAISEIIWNSLDADAKNVRVNFKENNIGGYEHITIQDDGHGLDYRKAQVVFAKLGGSAKKETQKSPGGRLYHGKEGKGRFKALALGDLIIFTSVYQKKGKKYKFKITVDRNNLTNAVLADEAEVSRSESTGFEVSLQNVRDEAASKAFSEAGLKEIEEKLALYYINYQDFNIFFNGTPLEFRDLIKDSHEEPVRITDEDEVTHVFNIKVLEWKIDCQKKTYYCNTKGIPFKEGNLGIRPTLPISIFIQSAYIEGLHRENRLDLFEMDDILQEAFKSAKKIARAYQRKKQYLYSKELIEELKRQKIYPYEKEAENAVEEAERQVFDIVALQIHEYLPKFGESELKEKKLTLALIKKALESDTEDFQKIMSDVLELPDEKRQELRDLLDKTSLTHVIDTMKDVTDRITFLTALELLIYDPEMSKNVLERKHLHQILKNETWVFGDEYTYGADDITLKNVLKEYLKALGREDFEEVVNSGDNEDLQIIPDVCLWRQFSLGRPEHFENLIIELKKPTVAAGFKELSQIQQYAQRIQKDSRFPKDKTKWTFYLVTSEVKEELEPQLNQDKREYGHVTQSANLDVHVVRWGDIISKAKARYRYIKEKLNYNLESNEDALTLLRNKYQEYLPEDLEAMDRMNSAS